MPAEEHTQRNDSGTEVSALPQRSSKVHLRVLGDAGPVGQAAGPCRPRGQVAGRAEPTEAADDSRQWREGHAPRPAQPVASVVKHNTRRIDVHALFFSARERPDTALAQSPSHTPV